MHRLASIAAALFAGLLVFKHSATGPSSALAKEESTSRTKMEAFEGQSGAVMVLGFSEVGAMKGVLGGTISIQAREVTSALTRESSYGIAIDIKSTDRLERTHRSFIDFDEIDSLVSGLDYVSKVDKNVTKLDNFQADYRTKGTSPSRCSATRTQSWRASRVAVWVASESI